PDPADQRRRSLITEAEVFRQPQEYRLVGDRVGGVDQELDQEREPKLAPRAFEHGKLGDESAKSIRRRWRNDFFRGNDFSNYFAHGVAFELQHLGYKSARVEWRKVVDFFAGADEAGRDFQFVLNRNDDPAFTAAVELGHD